jgi:cellobiose phosphorylase
MLTGQESNGGAMPEVKPYAHKPGRMPLTPPEQQRSDDCLWFFNAIPAYVNETGDFAFYKKVLPYSDRGRDTVFGHLKRALLFNLKRTGKHGLPCGLHADWDDCIRMGHRGETTMVAFQLRYGLGVYADLARQLGKPKETTWAENEREKLDRKIQKHTWDGEWFIRGITEKGKPLGSARCEEGKIFQVPQTWAVLSGAATPRQARKAMDSVEKHLETKYGCMAVAPPYVKAECKELRMVLMNPGEKENAGIFSHSQGWIIMANCMLGDGDRAYRVYRANLPGRFNDLAEIRKIEPYCYCQSTSSRYSAREGMSHIPWLTGSAAWSYFAPTQYILGIRPERDGLRIDPCIPAEWPGFSAERFFRGKKVIIEVRNPRRKNRGVKKIILNGETLPDNLLPVRKLKKENKVVCQIG